MSDSTAETDSKSGNLTNQEPPTWEDFIDGPNYYEDCYTVDPSNVDYAWDKLGQSTLFLQISALPAFIFFGFKKTFEEYFGEKGPSE